MFLKKFVAHSSETTLLVNILKIKQNSLVHLPHNPAAIMTFAVERNIRDNFTITPEPICDSQETIYVIRTFPKKLDGTDFSQHELTEILSQQCFFDHHETTKAGQSSKGISGSLKKISNYSSGDKSGIQDYRIQEVPIGTGILWEAVLLICFSYFLDIIGVNVASSPLILLNNA